MSELDPNSQSNRGWVYPNTPESIGDRYHPEIVAVLTVDGTPSLQGLETTFRPVDETLVDFVIVTTGTPSLQTWRLEEGAATPLDDTEVAPADYNATTNDKHWKFVGASGGGGDITLTGDVTGTGPSPLATTIANDAVTFAKMQNIATNKNLGRRSASSGNVEELFPTVTVNVKDPPYSATGDGSTDDTSAIQSAITDVFNAGGGTIYFPKGTYLVNGAFDGTMNSILKIPFNDPSSNAVISIALVGEMQAPWATNLTSSLSGGVIIKSTKTGSGTRPAILSGAAWTGAPSVTDFNAVYLIIKGMTFRTYDDPSIDALRLQRIGRVSLEDVAVDTGVQTPSQPTHGTYGIMMPATSNFAINVCNRVAIQGYDTGLSAGEHFTSVYTIIAYCNIGFLINGANDQGATGSLCIVWCGEFVRYSGHAGVDLNLDLERAAGGNWYSTGNDINGITSFNYGSGVIRYALSNNTGRIAGPLTVNAPGDCQFIDLFNGRIRWNGDTGLQRDSTIGAGLWVTDGTPTNFRDLTLRALRVKAVTFANAIGSPPEGAIQAFTDSNTNVWGATIAGGGTNHVMGYYNGTNWTVMGK